LPSDDFGCEHPGTQQKEALSIHKIPMFKKHGTVAGGQNISSKASLGISV
jgi:hypothetical protein